MQGVVVCTESKAHTCRVLGFHLISTSLRERVEGFAAEIAAARADAAQASVAEYKAQVAGLEARLNEVKSVGCWGYGRRQRGGIMDLCSLCGTGILLLLSQVQERAASDLHAAAKAREKELRDTQSQLQVRFAVAATHLPLCSHNGLHTLVTAEGSVEQGSTVGSHGGCQGGCH